MIVLDAYAVIALLKGEPAAREVHEIVTGGDCGLTTLGLAEVVDHLVRLVGASEEDAVLDVAQLGLLPAVELTESDAVAAALLRARHYHRVTRAVSLADCVAAQVARRAGTALATSDPHLLDLCQAERVGVVPLPDSGGDRWSP